MPYPTLSGLSAASSRATGPGRAPRRGDPRFGGGFAETVAVASVIANASVNKGWSDRGARTGKELDVAGAHRLAAVRAVQLHVAYLAAGVVPIEHGWPGALVGELVPPGNHHHQEVDELRALDGEHVLEARGARLVLTALQPPGLDEPLQPLGQ